MPRAGRNKSSGKKSTPVKTRESGVNKMIREDVQRRQESKAVKGNGGGGRGGRRGS